MRIVGGEINFQISIQQQQNIARMIHLRVPVKPPPPQPTLAQCLDNFYKAFVIILQTFKHEDYHLIDFVQVRHPKTDTWEKVITMWGCQTSVYEVWLEIQYEQSVKSLIISSFLSRNGRIGVVTGVYYINLATNLFERYSKECAFNNKSLQFNINPLTGVHKIVSKMLISEDQYKIQLTRPEFLCNIFQQMSLILSEVKKLHELQLYFDGHARQCPIHKFIDQESDSQNSIEPQVFLKAIVHSLNKIDSNCEESLQNFGSPETTTAFIRKYEIDLPFQVMEIIDLLVKGDDKQKAKKEMSVSEIISKIYEGSLMENTVGETGLLVKKIKFLNQSYEANWEPFAEGGFGKIEKTKIRYQLCDFNNKNREQFYGEIVRKSDTKNSNKIEHEHKILSLFKNEQHSNIMQYYISEQSAHRKYIYSKFQPNLSLDKYIRANKKSISLQTVTRLMEHTLKGLMFLKEKHISHLDIKPNNIIVTRDLKAKLSDFGQAYYSQDDPVLHVHGHTIPYAPSQIYYYEPYLNSKVDVYSFGVTMYKVLFHDHLWGDIRDRQKFVKNLLQNQPEIQVAPEKLFQFGVPEILGVLINLSIKCVKRDQTERPSLFYLSVLLSLCRFYLYSLIDGAYRPLV